MSKGGINNVLDENHVSQDDQGHLWFDDYLRVSGSSLVSVVSLISHSIIQSENRPRRRKPKDEALFLTTVECIVANLAHVSLRSSTSIPLVVCRSKSVCRAYSSDSVPLKTFTKCLDALQRLGWLDQTVGVQGKYATTIEATDAFRALIQRHSISFSCFRECATRPLLILKRSLRAGPKRKPKKVPVPYLRSLNTDAMVAQASRLNTFLAAADIAFVDDCGLDRVDTGRRTLVRYFTIIKEQTERFDQGGRLFGRAFWMALPSHRRGGIRIDGEPVADLDFCNLGPRLAYAKLGVEAPEGDLYDLTGLLKGYDHANRGHRKAVKRGLASCFNGGAAGSRDILDGLPKRTTAKKLRDALLVKHPAFRELFEADGAPVGYSIMFDESRILLCALEKLMEAGVVALPQHDGLMVARSNQRIAGEALQGASEEIVGVRLPVDVKADYGVPEAIERLLAA